MENNNNIKVLNNQTNSLTSLTTEQIQKILDENKEIILTVVDLQRENKLNECQK
jgi:hypothetical protein